MSAIGLALAQRPVGVSGGMKPVVSPELIDRLKGLKNDNVDKEIMREILAKRQAMEESKLAQRVGNQRTDITPPTDPRWSDPTIQQLPLPTNDIEGVDAIRPTNALPPRQISLEELGLADRGIEGVDPIPKGLESPNYWTKEDDLATRLGEVGGSVGLGELSKNKDFSQLKKETEELKIKAMEGGGAAVREWRDAYSKIQEIENRAIQNKKDATMQASRKRDIELRAKDQSVDKTTDLDATYLLGEAKKHDTLDGFMSHMRGSATQYGGYTPKARKFVQPTAKRVSDFEGIRPNQKVTIYRGIDTSEGKARMKINSGDFVTTDFDSALAYTDSPSKVTSMEVPAKDLIEEFPDEFNTAEPFGVGSEFIYSKSTKPMVKITDTKLIDIFNKAKKGK